MTTHAAAYIRRSSESADSPGDASRENQRRACEALASIHCPDLEVREYGKDWGVSGRKDDRKDYQKLRTAIAAGEVCAVVTYSLSRLGRTSRELLDFFEFCDQHSVPAYSQAEGQLTPAKGAHAIFIRGVLIQMAQLESDLAKERTRAIIDLKRERGDVMGQPKYGFRRVRDAGGRYILEEDPGQPFAPIRQAMIDAGTVLGAARLLQQRGVRAPKGGQRWSTSALTRIVSGAAPELLQRRGPSGRRRTPSAAPLAGLLECHCGQTMTPNVRRGQYYCARGRDLGGGVHGKMAVTEAPLLSYLRRETERLFPTGVTPTDQSRREALEAEKERLGWAVTDGLLDRDQAKKRAAIINAALSEMGERDSDARRLRSRVEWSAPPKELNDQLTAAIRAVRLDTSLQPVEVDWRHPAWVAPEGLRVRLVGGSRTAT